MISWSAAGSMQFGHQRPGKQKATIVGAGMLHWSFKCNGCGLGVCDPDGSATHCPNQSCKLDITKATPDVPKAPDAKAPPQLGSLQLSKNTGEAMERVENLGADGALPPTKAATENSEKLAKAKKAIEVLK